MPIRTFTWEDVKDRVIWYPEQHWPNTIRPVFQDHYVDYGWIWGEVNGERVESMYENPAGPYPFESDGTITVWHEAYMAGWNPYYAFGSHNEFGGLRIRSAVKGSLGGTLDLERFPTLPITARITKIRFRAHCTGSGTLYFGVVDGESPGAPGAPDAIYPPDEEMRPYTIYISGACKFGGIGRFDDEFDLIPNHVFFKNDDSIDGGMLASNPMTLTCSGGIEDPEGNPPTTEYPSVELDYSGVPLTYFQFKEWFSQIRFTAYTAFDTWPWNASSWPLAWQHSCYTDAVGPDNAWRPHVTVSNWSMEVTWDYPSYVIPVLDYIGDGGVALSGQAAGLLDDGAGGLDFHWTAEGGLRVGAFGAELELFHVLEIFLEGTGGVVIGGSGGSSLSPRGPGPCPVPFFDPDTDESWT